MEFSYISLDPVQVTKPAERNQHKNRTWEGIPSIERIPSGRLFAVWYAGGPGEGKENYSLLAYSDDNGNTWSDAVAVIDPKPQQVRSFDTVIWLAPDGRLFWFWAQGCGGECNSGQVFDGMAGVWFTVLENPEATPEDFRFTPSRRIANGIMINKPTVLKDGTWAFPCSVWKGDYLQHPSLGVHPGAFMVVSTDRGETFSIRGCIDSSLVEGGNDFDEHTFVETKSGMIRCYMRVSRGIGESTSTDGGRTWHHPILSKIKSPASRIFVGRLKSGALLMIRNDSIDVRKKMTACLSLDEGETWPYSLLLKEEAHVSYPNACQGDDGTIYIVYDKDRFDGGYIYFSRITEEDIMQGRICSPNSTLNVEIAHSRSTKD